MITRALLIALGIDRTCVLHGDYYHLFHEEWLSPNNFGPILYPQIKQYLDLMLNSKTKDQWDIAYQNTKDILYNHPDKVETLDQMHYDPEYYSGYYLHTICCNMYLRRSSGAEQNHASLQAFLSADISSSITFEIRALLEHRQQHYKQSCENEISVHMSSHNFQPTFSGNIAIADLDAKKTLSKYGYENLWLKPLKASSYLQSVFSSEEKVYYVWPKDSEVTNFNKRIYQFGERCCCLYRVAFDHKYEHELCVDYIFDSSLYDEVWYNHWYWNSMNESYLSNLVHGNKSEVQCSIKRKESVSIDFEKVILQPNGDNIEQISMHNIDDDDDMNTHEPQIEVSYNDICHVFSDIARAVQYDRSEKSRVLVIANCGCPKSLPTKDYEIHILNQSGVSYVGKKYNNNLLHKQH